MSHEFENTLDLLHARYGHVLLELTQQLRLERTPAPNITAVTYADLMLWLLEHAPGVTTEHLQASLTVASERSRILHGGSPGRPLVEVFGQMGDYSDFSEGYSLGGFDDFSMSGVSPFAASRQHTPAAVVAEPPILVPPLSPQLERTRVINLEPTHAHNP